MINEQHQNSSPLLLQIGAIAAILGTIFQVGAGTLSTSLPTGGGEEAMQSLGGQSSLLTAIYLGFILGAVLWVWALVALASDLTMGNARALGLLAVASAFIGATLHAVDGVLHGVALPALAASWTGAPDDARGALVQDLDLLRHLFAATWAGVILLFHGVPFVLAGLAVAISQRYPAWLGWIGFVGGAGSIIIGLAMFFGAAPAGLAVPFAVVLSAFMVILGWLMWSQSDLPAVERGRTPPPVISSRHHPSPRSERP